MAPAPALAQVVTGPETTFQSGPEDPTPTNDPTPTFTFSSTDPIATFECAVDSEQPSACSSPYTAPALADGPHTLSVRAVDSLQNAGDWATRSFTVDATAPDVTIGSGPADSSTTSDPTPTFGFSSTDLSATFQCLVDGGQAAACGSPFTTAALSDGPHSFEVRAVDAAGNPGSAARSFTVDATPPTVSIGSGPDEGSTTNDRTPTFGFSSSEPDSSFQCSVDGGAFEDCSSPRTTATLSDGPHSFAVRATDAIGNQGAATTRSLTVDTTAPTASIGSGPADGATTGDPTPTFGFSSNDSEATFECSVDDAPFAACSPPGITATLADGPHSFAVRAVDAAGNGSAAATRSFTVDTVAPSVSIDGGPGGPTNDPTPTFSFSSGDAAAALLCSVDGAGFKACSSPHTTGALADGPHTFQVRAVDSAGNQATSAVRNFSVDTGAPGVTISSGPSGPTEDATPRFEFSSGDASATFECSVDGAAFADCASPHTTALLTDGPHSFAVRSVDAAGNHSTADTSNFTVDTVAPTASIGSGPADGAVTGDPTPTFGFSSNETGVQYQCAVDGGAFAGCSSPHTTAALADGSRTFSVRAIDAAGNQGAAATRGFTVDTIAPDVTIDAGPADPTPTADTTPTFLFSSDDDTAGLQCSLDGGGFAECASPHTTATLSEGAHQLRVRALDAAGNQSPAVTRGFTVDSSVPAVTFTGGPEGPTREQRPTFTFTSGPGATFQCKLDGAAVPCASGSFTPAAKLPDGEHFFEAAATSPAGVAGSGTLRVFTVDTTGPETVIAAAPAAQTTERTPRIEFVSPEASATFECSVDGGDFRSCSSPWTTPSLALGPHRVEVRALDALGNADGSPALAEFTVAAPPPPPPPPVLSVDAGVKELAGSLVLDLDRATRPLATTEIRAILSRGGVTVRGVSALVPGTLAISASAPTRGSTKTVLAGSHRFAAAGTAALVLKPTRAGRAMMTRYATIPLLLRASFTTVDGLALSANRETQLVRDYLTAAEAKRAVARRLAGIEGARVKSLAVQVMRRCASNCLKVQASWVAKQRRWTAAVRARQVHGRLLANLGETVSARH